MSRFTLRILLAAAAGLALPGLAHAQPGLTTGPDYDKIFTADRVVDNAERDLALLRNAAVEALNAKDFARAEPLLADLVGRMPTTDDASFLMGLAKSGLGKWAEARTHLEAAVTKQPKRPEARTRLGVAYVELGDADAAKAQRAELASLQVACAKACADAIWINDGMIEIDNALARRARALTLAANAAAAAAAMPTGDSAIAETVNFDPTKYNLVTFEDTTDLYDLLTAEGRCVPKEMAERRQPCALILYRPDDLAAGGLSANFKPVFRVDSRKSIWAIHDKKLQKVEIENLYADAVDVIGQKRTTYRSIALVGNAENKANCDAARPCLGDLVAQDMFRMYGNMPDSVVEVIWGPVYMKDSSTVRVR